MHFHPICWFEIFKLTEDYRYLNAALKANDVLKGLQIVSKDKSINGSLPASSPAWGDYGTYKINTWGVKYALDAWILEYKIKETKWSRIKNQYLLTKMENVVPAIIPPKRAMMISEVDISIYD